LLLLPLLSFLALADIFTCTYQNKHNTQFGTDHQSVQSEAGKVSCNKTAL